MYGSQTTFLLLILTCITFDFQGEVNGENSEHESCFQSTKDVDVQLDSLNQRILCNCSAERNENIIWKNYDCQNLSSDELNIVGLQKEALIVKKNPQKTWVVYCSNDRDCAYKITVIQPASGISSGVQGFLVFLIVAVILLLGYFILKKCRLQIYLGCRDSCVSPDNEDGKEFDAYVSIGKNVSDIKFINKNLTEVLQNKYNYNLVIDEENLLPQLDYSESVKAKMHKCKRLIIVFTPAYMTNEWCMYCFAEGLRKLLELRIPMIFLVSDNSIMREFNAQSQLIQHIPKIFMSMLPMAQNKTELERIIRKVRFHMPASKSRSSGQKGMRAPMLSEIEDVDRTLPNGEDDSFEGRKYTFKDTSTNHQGNNDNNIPDDGQDFEYDDEDPSSIRVNQYEARRDFFRIAMVDN